MSRNTYRLGGIPTRRWHALRRKVGNVIVAAGTACLILMVATRNVWLLLAAVAIFGLGLVAWMLPSPDGKARWIDVVVGERARRLLARWGHWDEYDPEHDRRPWALDRYRIREWDDGDEQIGLIDTGRSIVTVLEIEGGGDGIRNDTDHHDREATWVSALDVLAGYSSGVQQIDVVTSHRPTDPRPHAEWAADRGGDVVAAAEELLRSVSETTAPRVWAVIHMDVDALARKVREWGLRVDADELDAAARAVTATTVTTLHNHGYPVRRLLSAAQVAGVVRSILDPSRNPDDTADCDEFWTAWPGYEPTKLGDAAVTYSPDRDRRTLWYHAAGGISRDDFPLGAVPGRWLSPIHQAAIPNLAVTVSYTLVHHREARAIALDRGTDRDVARLRKAQKGARSDGTIEQALTVADAITHEVAVEGHAGVIVGVTINVSATHARELRRLRELAEVAVEQRMGATLTWHDGRQPMGLLRALPVGVRVR